MYECIEIPDQPITTTSTTTITTQTRTTSRLTTTTNHSSTSTSDPYLNWRDDMDQNDLKVLRMLSILELVIAFLLLGSGYHKISC